MSTTTNLADFGNRELDMAGELLSAYANRDDNNLKYFTGENVTLMMNSSSGNVFLTDSEYNVLMMNDGKLEEFFCSPYNGIEGFLSDLTGEYGTMHEEDKTWLQDIAAAYGKLPELIRNEELKDFIERGEINDSEDFGYTIERSQNTGREPKDDISYELTITKGDDIVYTFNFYNSEEDAQHDIAILEKLEISIN